MPRWLLYAIFAVTVATAAAGLLTMRRATLPEDCRTAGASLEAQDYDRAIDDYLACLDVPDLSDAVLAQIYYGLGIAYAAKGNHYQAVEDYGEAIRLAPNFPWAYNNRCWSYGQLRMAEKALADCNEAVRLAPEEAAILDSRALAHWLSDQFDKARRDLERAHALDPTTPTPEERFRQFEAMF